MSWFIGNSSNVRHQTYQALFNKRENRPQISVLQRVLIQKLCDNLKHLKGYFEAQAKI